MYIYVFTLTMHVCVCARREREVCVCVAFLDRSVDDDVEASNIQINKRRCCSPTSILTTRERAQRGIMSLSAGIGKATNCSDAIISSTPQHPLCPTIAIYFLCEWGNCGKCTTKLPDFYTGGEIFKCFYFKALDKK